MPTDDRQPQEGVIQRRDGPQWYWGKKRGKLSLDKMQQIGEILKHKTFEESQFKNRRDEIISKMTEAINTFRKGTEFRPITKRLVAIRANKNPFLKNNDELEFVYKECLHKGSFAHFFWITK